MSNNRTLLWAKIRTPLPRWRKHCPDKINKPNISRLSRTSVSSSLHCFFTFFASPPLSRMANYSVFYAVERKFSYIIRDNGLSRYSEFSFRAEIESELLSLYFITTNLMCALASFPLLGSRRFSYTRSLVVSKSVVQAYLWDTVRYQRLFAVSIQ